MENPPWAAEFLTGEGLARGPKVAGAHCYRAGFEPFVYWVSRRANKLNAGHSGIRNESSLSGRGIRVEEGEGRRRRRGVDGGSSERGKQENRVYH